MTIYRFLNDSDREAVHVAFLNAFSDYQVNMQMTRDEFDFRLRRDGVDLTKSAGAFEENEMVGFTLNSVGEWPGGHTIYDAGTGVVPRARGRGIAKALFNFMGPQLKLLGFEQYLLEVITTNDVAANLYRRLGFKDTRKLAVFRTNTQLELRVFKEDAELREVSVLDWNLYKKFWDSYPSWQNSPEAVDRTTPNNVVLEVWFDGNCVGYGVVSKTSGNLYQLAIDRPYRRKGLGSLLIDQLQRRVVTGDPIKVNNVDEELNDALAFYKSVGFQLVLEQYEMSKEL
jgi:ribosomal protein S18 acetylase RimI-like enzyme